MLGREPRRAVDSALQTRRKYKFSFFFRFFKLKNTDFRLTVTTQKLFPFSLISCVYSYAIVYTWL